MNDEVPGESSPFFRATMTGLAVGIGDTILCLIYNLIYRDSGGYFPSFIISIPSIIFGVNILFLAIGVLYYAFLQGRQKGEFLFSLLFFLLTVIGCIASLHVRRTANHYMNVRFRALLMGVIIILGVSAVLIPVFYHSKKFHKYIV